MVPVAEAAAAGRWPVLIVPADEPVGVCQCVFVDPGRDAADGAADPRAGGVIAVA